MCIRDRYIGYWNGETEGSPIGFATIFWGFETWNYPYTKVVDFEPLGALFGLGAPEAVLIDFVAGRNLKYSLNGGLTEKHWNSLVISTIIHQTLIFITGLKHSASCGEGNHCNSLLKWTSNSPNPYFCKSTQTCPQKNVMFPCSKWRKGHVQLGALFRETVGEEENPPQFALATRNDIAPLICRVVRAMRAVRWRWALGLDSRWGTPLRSVSTPNLRPLWWNHKIHNAHLNADPNAPTSKWTSKIKESELHSDMYFRFADLGCPFGCWGILICISMGVVIFMVPP